MKPTMTPEQHRKASELFLQMRDLSAEQRLALLEAEQDSEVRDEATSLLAASDGCGDFLERSVQVNVTANLAEGKIARGDSPESAVVVDATTEQANPAGGTLQQVGRYRLLQQIGEGGHGTVFMAEQTDPVSRKVAVKLIKPGMDSKQVLARFQAERQALAMMDHPSIARMIDGGRASERSALLRDGVSERDSDR